MLVFNHEAGYEILCTVDDGVRQGRREGGAGTGEAATVLEDMRAGSPSISLLATSTVRSRGWRHPLVASVLGDALVLDHEAGDEIMCSVDDGVRGARKGRPQPYWRTEGGEQGCCFGSVRRIQY